MKRTVKIATFILMGAALVVCLCFYFSLNNYFVIDGSLIGGEEKVMMKEGSVDDSAIEVSDKIVLIAVGDIMLSRVVEQKMMARNDWNYPFLETASITSGADIAFGNLETTVFPGNVVPSGSFAFRTDPKALEGLKLAGFDVLSLANNHMMNFGRNGLEKTLQNLDATEIEHTGAGLSEEDIYAPIIEDVRGVKIGFLSYSYAKEQSYDKTGEIYGTAYLDVVTMKTQVEKLKQSVDVVVVSMHAGIEYEIEPSVAQKNFAHAAVDAGAELVIGHHPHVVETFEKYNDGYIIYSLGNFVFDQMWSEETRLGAIAEITFENKKISDIRFVPVKIFDYAQPKLAEGVDKEKILERLEIKG